MYAVNIALGTTVWRLLFKEEGAARAAFDATWNHQPDDVIALKDDFGQVCNFPAAQRTGSMFEDFDQSKLANIELFLHQQRVQAAAQKAAQSDPGLRASAAMGGPSVLTPFRQN